MTREDVSVYPNREAENQQKCQVCQSPFTVKHISIHCTCFSAARQSYLGVNTLEELVQNVESRNITAFIKDIDFYHRLYRCCTSA